MKKKEYVSPEMETFMFLSSDNIACNNISDIDPGTENPDFEF